jgi:hypothetical protein
MDVYRVGELFPQEQFCTGKEQYVAIVTNSFFTSDRPFMQFASIPAPFRRSFFVEFKSQFKHLKTCNTNLVFEENFTTGDTLKVKILRISKTIPRLTAPLANPLPPYIS